MNQVDDSLFLNIVSKVGKLGNRSGFRWIFEWGALSFAQQNRSFSLREMKWRSASYTVLYKKKSFFFLFPHNLFFTKTACLKTDSPFVRLGRPWALSWCLSSQKNAVDPIAVERAETSSPDRSRKHDCDLSAPCRVFENFVLSGFLLSSPWGSPLDVGCAYL